MSRDVTYAVLVILVYTKLWNQVECLSTGAPAEACTTLTPSIQFHIDPPQSSPVPYEVDLLSLDNGDSFSYDPGETYAGAKMLFAAIMLYGLLQ